MNGRLAAVIAVAAAIVSALIAYTVGVQYGGRLSDSQKAATEILIKDYLAAHPELTAAPPVSAPATPVARADQQATLSDEQRTEVEAVIRGYLIANPEIIRDAINELQRKEDLAAQAQQTKAIADNQSLLFTSTRQVVLGNPNGDVTLVEFFDYNCGYCKRAHADMKRLIEEDKNLKFVLKEFPVLGEGSMQAAQVAVAVLLTAPEKYGEFHDKLISERGQVNGDKALAAAGEIGLDRTVLAAKLESEEVKATISEVYDLAGKLNLTGTPSYVTGKEVIVGAVGYDELKTRISQARCGQPSC